MPPRSDASGIFVLIRRYLPIQAAFANPKTAFHRGMIVVPTEPLDMDALLKSAFEDEEDEDALYDEGPDGVCEKIGRPLPASTRPIRSMPRR